MPTRAMSREVHIAGIVVHATPDAVDTIRAAVSLLPKAQVHAAAHDGRMVITLETDSTRQTLDQMDAIRAMSGVLNVSLVYQHAEPAAALDEEA